MTATVSDAESGLLSRTANRNGSGSNRYGGLPTEGRGEGQHREEPVPSFPGMLIYGGFLLIMSTRGTMACFETLGAEYAMTHFGMTSAEAGSTFATFGMIGVVSFCAGCSVW